MLRGVRFAKLTVERLLVESPELRPALGRTATLANVVAAERPTPEYFPEGQVPDRVAAIAELEFAAAPSKPWVVVVDERPDGPIAIRGFGEDLGTPIAEVYVGGDAG